MNIEAAIVSKTSIAVSREMLCGVSVNTFFFNLANKLSNKLILYIK